MRLVPWTRLRNTWENRERESERERETLRIKSPPAIGRVDRTRRDAYLRQPGDVQAFAVLHGGLAGFARPRPLALAVGEAGPGEDVVVGQVQVRGVHGELADQLQQAGQAVQQPLRREERFTRRTNQTTRSI